MRRAWLHSDSGGGGGQCKSQPAGWMEVGSKISSSSSPSVTLSVLTFLPPLFAPTPTLPNPLHTSLPRASFIYPQPIPYDCITLPGSARIAPSPPRPLAPIRNKTSNVRFTSVPWSLGAWCLILNIPASLMRVISDQCTGGS